MPLQPSRRDNTGPASTIRHHQSYLRGLDPGGLDGRSATPQPVLPGPSPLVGGDTGGGDGEDNAVIGEDGDRHTLTTLNTQVWPLSYDPIAETVHVRWHPGGGAGVPWLRDEFWTIDDDDNVITIRAEALASAHAQVGDVFSAQYLRLEGEQGPDDIDFYVAGFTEPGDWDDTAEILTYDLPAGTVDGSLLVLTVRGNVAPGGGELVFDATCTDPRMTLAYRATIVNSGQVIVEAVWVGMSTASTDPVEVAVVTNPSYNGAAEGVLGAFNGVNGWGVISPNEVGDGSTPVVSGIAAIAVTWIRGASFTVVNAASPDGYTFGASTGFDYSSTAIGYWYDPVDGVTSPAGDFVGEGCCVIAVI